MKRAKRKLCGVILPKEHIAAGDTLHIATRPMDWGVSGEFFFLGEYIHLNSTLPRRHTVLEALIHECLESSMQAAGMRFTKPSVEKDYFFVFDHMQFANVCSELARTVGKLLDLNSKPKGKWHEREHP